MSRKSPSLAHFYSSSWSTTYPVSFAFSVTCSPKILEGKTAVQRSSRNKWNGCKCLKEPTLPLSASPLPDLAVPNSGRYHDNVYTITCTTITCSTITCVRLAPEIFLPVHSALVRPPIEHCVQVLSPNAILLWWRRLRSNLIETVNILNSLFLVNPHEFFTIRISQPAVRVVHSFPS